jgi:thiol-disulfide isomerase/thioredoxin
MFSAEHCTYCEKLEEDFLKPMLRSGDYDDRVLIRKVKIDGFGTIRDFDGNKVDAEAFADRYKVYVTPTVVFIDGDGAQLARKRVGLSTPDFYGGYLDQSIDTALDVLRRNKPLRVKLSALEE